MCEEWLATQHDRIARIILHLTDAHGPMISVVLTLTSSTEETCWQHSLGMPVQTCQRESRARREEDETCCQHSLDIPVQKCERHILLCNSVLQEERLSVIFKNKENVSVCLAASPLPQRDVFWLHGKGNQPPARFLTSLDVGGLPPRNARVYERVLPHEEDDIFSLADPWWLRRLPKNHCCCLISVCFLQGEIGRCAVMGTLPLQIH